jgi:hypothetical protein
MLELGNNGKSIPETIDSDNTRPAASPNEINSVSTGSNLSMIIFLASATLNNTDKLTSQD